MKNNINKLFNLQGLLTGKIEFSKDDKQVILNARNPRTFSQCPYCLKSTKKSSSNQ